jgi:hypothetical protein
VNRRRQTEEIVPHLRRFGIAVARNAQLRSGLASAGAYDAGGCGDSTAVGKCPTLWVPLFFVFMELYKKNVRPCPTLFQRRAVIGRSQGQLRRRLGVLLSGGHIRFAQCKRPRSWAPPRPTSFSCHKAESSECQPRLKQPIHLSHSGSTLARSSRAAQLTESLRKVRDTTTYTLGEPAIVGELSEPRAPRKMEERTAHRCGFAADAA